MKKHLLLYLCCLIAGPCFAGVLRMSLSEAVKAAAVRVSAINTMGAYQGTTTEVTITNMRKEAMQIKIDIGTVLWPDSAEYQPMILAGEELLAIAPSGTGSVTVQTFCGAHSKRCPARGHHYAYAGTGSDTLVTVLRFIKANNIFDDLGQDAVWAVTGNHELSNIYDDQRQDLAARLLQVVIKATGKPEPGYRTVNAPRQQVPDAPAYVPKALRILATFRLALEEPQTLTLGVYNDKGEMIQSVFENKEFPRSGHEFEVEFEAADVSAGYYYIRLMAGAAVLQEKKVKVE